jgi:hypothetical protein
MSIKINVELTNEEFDTLNYILGELRRITRDQYYRFVEAEYCYSECRINKERFEIAQSLLKKLVEDNKV